MRRASNLLVIAACLVTSAKALAHEPTLPARLMGQVRLEVGPDRQPWGFVLAVAPGPEGDGAQLYRLATTRREHDEALERLRLSHTAGAVISGLLTEQDHRPLLIVESIAERPEDPSR